MERSSIAAGLIACLLTIGVGGVVMAQPASPSLTALDQRIELPEAGIAVAFPDDWTVVVVGVEPDESTEHSQLAATSPLGASCEVSLHDGSVWSDLDEWAESALENFQGYGPELMVAATSLSLPVGDAIRIDLDAPDEGFSGAFYLLTDGAAFIGLACNASDPPADRWLFIAQTLEMMPKEG